MREILKRRVIEEANILINTGMSVSELSRLIRISKSTIYNDIRYKLKDIDYNKYNDIKKLNLWYFQNNLDNNLKKCKKNTIILRFYGKIYNDKKGVIECYQKILE